MDFNKTKNYFKGTVPTGFIWMGVFFAAVGFLFGLVDGILIFNILGVFSAAVTIIMILYNLPNWTAPKGKEIDKMCREYSGNLVERCGKPLDISEGEEVTTINIFGYSLDGIGTVSDCTKVKDYPFRTALAVNTMLAFEEDKIEVYMHKFNLVTAKEETSVDSILYGEIQDIKVEEPAKPYVELRCYNHQIKYFSVLHYYTYSGKDILIPLLGSVSNNCNNNGALDEILQQVISLSKKD